MTERDPKQKAGEQGLEGTREGAATEMMMKGGEKTREGLAFQGREIWKKDLVSEGH